MFTSAFIYNWSKIEGPGNVIFSNPNNTTTNANFSQEGVYKIQLKAIDKVTLGNNYFTTLIDEIEIIVIDSADCVDGDGDGICSIADCDDNNNLIPDLPGKRCNDYDDNTSREVIQEDNCTCAGGSARIVTTACGSNIEIVHGAGEITINSLNGEYFFVKVWPGSDIYLGQENKIFENSSILESTTTIPNVPEGDYVIWVRTTGYADICIFPIYVTLPLELDNLVSDPDNDNDNIPASQDCDDNDSNYPKTPGTPCDDGDGDTINDAIQSEWLCLSWNIC